MGAGLIGSGITRPRGGTTLLVPPCVAVNSLAPGPLGRQLFISADVAPVASTAGVRVAFRCDAGLQAQDRGDLGAASHPSACLRP